MRTIHNICTTTTTSRVHPAFYHRTNICSVFRVYAPFAFPYSTSFLRHQYILALNFCLNISIHFTAAAVACLLRRLFHISSFLFSSLFFFRFSSTEQIYFSPCSHSLSCRSPGIRIQHVFFSLLSHFGQTLQSETLTRLDMMKISHFSRIKICFLLLLFSHFIPPSGKLFYVELPFWISSSCVGKKFSASQIYMSINAWAWCCMLMRRDLNIFRKSSAAPAFHSRVHTYPMLMEMRRENQLIVLCSPLFPFFPVSLTL